MYHDAKNTYRSETASCVLLLYIVLELGEAVCEVAIAVVFSSEDNTRSGTSLVSVLFWRLALHNHARLPWLQGCPAGFQDPSHCLRKGCSACLTVSQAYSTPATCSYAACYGSRCSSGHSQCACHTGGTSLPTTPQSLLHMREQSTELHSPFAKIMAMSTAMSAPVAATHSNGLSGDYPMLQH